MPLGLVFVAGLGLGVLLGPRLTGEIATPSAGAARPPAGPPASAGIRDGYPAEVLRVIDGDTFEARVRAWPGMEIVTKVRLRGIDAPELRAQCKEERRGAEAAHDALAALLKQGEVAISRVSLDKYGGRVVADASTRLTPNVSDALLKAGVARPYSGGRRESWCSRLSQR